MEVKILNKNIVRRPSMFETEQNKYLILQRH